MSRRLCIEASRTSAQICSTIHADGKARTGLPDDYRSVIISVSSQFVAIKLPPISNLLSWSCAQLDLEAEQARKGYEQRWQRLCGSTTKNANRKQKLAYIDIPWPLDEFASSELLLSVVFAGTLVSGPGLVIQAMRTCPCVCSVSPSETCWERRCVTSVDVHRGVLLTPPTQLQRSHSAELLEAVKD